MAWKVTLKNLDTGDTKDFEVSREHYADALIDKLKSQRLPGAREDYMKQEIKEHRTGS